MAYMYIYFLILFAVFEESFSELCISGYYSSYRYYTYCSSGCCGSYYNEYCCSSLEVGTIAGIVIGCIFALVILVVVIICVCAQCKKKKTGVVISNNQPHTAVAFVNTSAQHGGYQQPPPSYPANYAYPASYVPPPAYPPGAMTQPGPSDPAYPPPNTAPPAYPGPPPPQKY